ncbi:MAG: hypothetical protein HY744_16480 [Deltaproteobacteria bacterium]|nr:hypothetical protein [Deltaproteobacteria bacterium]
MMPRAHLSRSACAAPRVLRVAVLLSALLLPAASGAQPPAPAQKATVKGQIKGGEALLNPVWREASSTESHRYTFRAPSATVSEDAKRLTGFLPRELAIVALGPEKVAPTKTPVVVTLSGGRTTPATVVVPEGQPVQIENHDPFVHRIYDSADKGLGKADLEPTRSRTWTPPGPGSYELRDDYFPSVRSWIVVEPKAVAVVAPSLKGEFALELDAGKYTLRGYYAGQAVGAPLPVDVTGAPLTLQAPLVVGEGKGKEAGKGR